MKHKMWRVTYAIGNDPTLRVTFDPIPAVSREQVIAETTMQFVVPSLFECVNCRELGENEINAIIDARGVNVRKIL